MLPRSSGAWLGAAALIMIALDGNIAAFEARSLSPLGERENAANARLPTRRPARNEFAQLMRS
jgi:hypothetical protein